MEKSTNSFADQIKIFLWVIFVVEVLAIGLGIIFGRLCGYKNSILAHGILGVIIGIGLLILLLVYIIIEMLIRYFSKEKKGKNE